MSSAPTIAYEGHEAIVYIGVVIALRCIVAWSLAYSCSSMHPSLLWSIIQFGIVCTYIIIALPSPTVEVTHMALREGTPFVHISHHLHV